MQAFHMGNKPQSPAPQAVVKSPPLSDAEKKLLAAERKAEIQERRLAELEAQKAQYWYDNRYYISGGAALGALIAGGIIGYYLGKSR